MLESNDNNFLFFFKPSQIDNQCIFNIPLKTAVQIISIILILASLDEFFDALSEQSYFFLIWNLLLSIFFLTVAIFSFLSTINQNYSYANISYIIYAITWYVKAVEFIYETIKHFIEFINPSGTKFFHLSYLVDIISDALYLLILLYFVWVVFCYSINLKNIY
jgi:hypothetical protein